MRLQQRIGLGYDSHRLEDGRPLILGGIEVPFDRGLKGHSDGDVLLHAIIDALCGAAGLPDIGRLFPNNDPQWEGADSWILLQEVGRKVRAAGWSVNNIDAVLIAERPKISPYAERMRERIAAGLEIDPDQVNLRGKTAEGMGPLGAGEGMEAHAISLLIAL